MNSISTSAPIEATRPRAGSSGASYGVIWLWLFYFCFSELASIPFGRMALPGGDHVPVPLGSLFYASGLMRFLLGGLALYLAWRWKGNIGLTRKAKVAMGLGTCAWALASLTQCLGYRAGLGELMHGTFLIWVPTVMAWVTVVGILRRPWVQGQGGPEAAILTLAMFGGGWWVWLPLMAAAVGGHPWLAETLQMIRTPLRALGKQANNARFPLANQISACGAALAAWAVWCLVVNLLFPSNGIIRMQQPLPPPDGFQPAVCLMLLMVCTLGVRHGSFLNRSPGEYSKRSGVGVGLTGLIMPICITVLIGSIASAGVEGFGGMFIGPLLVLTWAGSSIFGTILGLLAAYQWATATARAEAGQLPPPSTAGFWLASASLGISLIPIGMASGMLLNRHLVS